MEESVEPFSYVHAQSTALYAGEIYHCQNYGQERRRTQTQKLQGTFLRNSDFGIIFSLSEKFFFYSIPFSVLGNSRILRLNIIYQLYSISTRQAHTHFNRSSTPTQYPSIENIRTRNSINSKP